MTTEIDIQRAEQSPGKCPRECTYRQAQFDFTGTIRGRDKEADSFKKSQSSIEAGTVPKTAPCPTD